MSLPVSAACCRALVATPRRLARPRRPDYRLLAQLEQADRMVPTATTTVRLRPLVQTGQLAPTMVVAEGVFRPLRLRLGMTSFLVEHPEGRFLVDPAVCADVHRRVLPELPFPFRPLVTPKRPVAGLPEVLDRAGVSADEVDFPLPTHLHWDHGSGLSELADGLPVRTLNAERAFALQGARAPLGIARGPLRRRPVELDGPPVLAFARSHDVFGDGSVIVVDLAGHTPAASVLLALADDRRVLLAGYAVWHRLQIQSLREKAPFPGELVDADRDAAFATLHRLHALPSHIEVIASHDHAAAAAYGRQ